MATETQTETQTETKTEAKRLISLDVENVMRVEAVHLDFDPKGGLTVIGGKNGAGKTSTLKALEFAFRGGRAICEEPLRKGAKRGHVIVELEDMTVTREFKPKGRSTIKVAAKNGATFPSPQAMLDKLVGHFGFNPLEFLTYPPRKQAETLRELLGLDFSKLDADRAELYENRRNTGRDRDQLKGQLDGMTHHADAPAEEVSISELVAERDRRRAVNGDNQAERHELEKYSRLILDQSEFIKSKAREVEEAKEALANAEEALAQAVKHRAKIVAVEKAQAEKVQALQDEDVDEVTERINSAETVNQQVRENQARANVANRLNHATGEYNQLTAKIERIDAEKERMLAEAQFPIEGLSFADEGVLLNGLPFEQAGDAEKLQVSVAMGLAMNKGLKLLLVDGGERLDSDGLKLVERMAREAGAYVLMSRVSEGDECAVVIEDGKVVDDADNGGAEDRET